MSVGWNLILARVEFFTVAGIEDIQDRVILRIPSRVCNHYITGNDRRSWIQEIT